MSCSGAVPVAPSPIASGEEAAVAGGEEGCDDGLEQPVEENERIDAAPSERAAKREDRGAMIVNLQQGQERGVHFLAV
jgi:hypothetical protein